ncbi:hypothetical protein RRG08_055754 [Elysia crispata]|uniref:Uncharacterized protein n=1 Tax=Elysia crispata TaxID=231223 RepID=A0AAE1AB23_9GAST|nr:hypothetical protein RRG08_055754 [Elysia crispata]
MGSASAVNEHWVTAGDQLLHSTHQVGASICLLREVFRRNIKCHSFKLSPCTNSSPRYCEPHSQRFTSQGGSKSGERRTEGEIESARDADTEPTMKS